MWQMEVDARLVCVCVSVLDGMVAEEDTGIVSLGATS